MIMCMHKTAILVTNMDTGSIVTVNLSYVNVEESKIPVEFSFPYSLEEKISHGKK